jgi:hypothetical protein
VPLLQDVLQSYRDQKISREDLLQALINREFWCSDDLLMAAVCRLSMFYRSEMQVKGAQANSYQPLVFETMFKELVADDFEPVSVLTLLCREPEGETAELYDSELSPKSMINDKDTNWNRTVCTFVWKLVTEQAYGLFYLSHAPESRVPPATARIMSMTPAQILAKERAARFLLTSAFTSGGRGGTQADRFKALQQALGFSPWKYMIAQTQTFNLNSGTTGYVKATLEYGPKGMTIEKLERFVVSMCDITLVALARAALFVDPLKEFILMLQESTSSGKKSAPLISVFVVSNTLVSINEVGSVFYNAIPAARDE